MSIKIEFTIEPGWTHETYTDTIELDEADLEGLEGAEREKVIEGIVSDAVNNVCSWGWIEVGREDPE
jgi:hypothetical protein